MSLDSDPEHRGLIAQDCKKVFPEAVTKTKRFLTIDSFALQWRSSMQFKVTESGKTYPEGQGRTSRRASRETRSQAVGRFKRPDGHRGRLILGADHVTCSGMLKLWNTATPRV